MFKQLLNLALGRSKIVPVDEEEGDEDLLRYPPFMKGLPARPVEPLLELQSDLLMRVRKAVGAPRELYNEVYYSLIRRYAAYVHLLPASEGHHHRGSGGLLRHGLEVALWATQLADQVMWAMGEPPARRRELEPRWCCAVFVAALCHDVGKPMSDLKVTDQTGEHEWDPCEEDLADWCQRVGTRRYFIQWREGRHQRHESLTPMVLPRLIPGTTRQYLREAGPEMYQQMVAAISSRDFAASDQEHNRIYTIVRKADQQSTKKDLGDPARAGVPGALGVPLSRYLMDAMRRLVRSHKWSWNKPGARVWIINGEVFVVWPAGAEDIVKLLAKDNAPGIPRDPDTLADVLLERGLAKPFDAGDKPVRTWPIQPAAIREKNPGVVLHALRLAPEIVMFDELPGSVPALVGVELLEALESPASQTDPGKEEVEPTDSEDAEPQLDEGEAPPTKDGKDEAHDAAMARLLTPQPNRPSSESDDSPIQATPAPEPERETPAGNNQAEQSNTRSKANRENRKKTRAAEPAAAPASQSPQDTQADTKAAEAQTWLASQGHAGAVIAALAEDFRDGIKHWGEQGIQLSGGTVGIRHPEGWSGAGVAAKDMLPMLSKAGWIDMDPFQPMKKIREVDGFRRGKGPTRWPVLVLVEEVSQRFVAITQGARPSPPDIAPKAAAAPQPAKSANKKKGKGAPKATAPSGDTQLTNEEVIAALRAIVLGNTGLVHRREGAMIYIPLFDAVPALAQHLTLSQAKSRQYLFALRDTANSKEIAIVASETGK